MPKVYIIILNYNNWRDTIECLESVFRSSYENFSVVVIDNASQNRSVEHLKLWADENTYSYTFLAVEDNRASESLNSHTRLTFIVNHSNTGFAGGINSALRVLQDQEAYVWLLNPDMVIAENTLSELTQFAIQQPRNCIIGPVVKSYSSRQKILFYGGGRINFISGTIAMCRKKENISKLDYICGGALFTHAVNFRQLGGLPEKYFLYWEETDWCYGAKQRGFHLLVCESAVCYDKISSTIGKGFVADYYYTRNGLFFIKKFRGKNIPLVLVCAGLRFFKRFIKGEWKRARGVLKGTMDYLKSKPDESK